MTRVLEISLELHDIDLLVEKAEIWSRNNGYDCNVIKADLITDYLLQGVDCRKDGVAIDNAYLNEEE